MSTKQILRRLFRSLSHQSILLFCFDVPEFAQVDFNRLIVFLTTDLSQSLSYGYITLQFELKGYEAFSPMNY